VLVVTGSGEKAFVAGADIAEMADLDARSAQAFSRLLGASLGRLEASPKPTIAPVNGFALGGGGELAPARRGPVAPGPARAGQPETTLGLIPGAGGTQRLPRLVGRGRALDLILSGALIDAAEALRIGLVERVVPAASLREATTAYASTLLARSPVAMARAIE